MTLQETARWQALRDGLLRRALDEAVAALDAKASEGVQVTHSEAQELWRLHRENAALYLLRCAEAARMARVGEQSTHGSGV